MNIGPLRGIWVSVAGLVLSLPIAGCDFGPDVLIADASANAPADTRERPATGAEAAARRAPVGAATEASASAIAPPPTSVAGKPQSTSNTPPPTRPFSTVVVPLRNYPRVASTGRCAPTYLNGTRGTCIAEKPCRGYGIRDDANQVSCMCYVARGGCDLKSRCDDHVHACVADTKKPVESE